MSSPIHKALSWRQGRHVCTSSLQARAPLRPGPGSRSEPLGRTSLASQGGFPGGVPPQWPQRSKVTHQISVLPGLRVPGCSGTPEGYRPIQAGRGLGSGGLFQVLLTRMWPRYSWARGRGRFSGQTFEDQPSKALNPAQKLPAVWGTQVGQSPTPGILGGSGERPARPPGVVLPEPRARWAEHSRKPGRVTALPPGTVSV